jgi:hypothetical protein
MHNPKIKNLIETVLEKHDGFEYYGSSSEEEHGTCFKLQGIKATFSVSTLDGSLVDSYDVQIEGIPAGDYVYTAELTLPKFLQLIVLFEKPEVEWP